MNTFNKSFPAILLIFLSIAFAYFGLINSFFEQDEWHTFGRYIYLASQSGTGFWNEVLQSGPLSHFTPLSLFFKMTLYQFFGLNASAYFTVSILLHTLVSVSVYFLALHLTRMRLPAFIGAIFFSLNSSHYQAVTWLGTFEGTQIATLFGIISILGILLFLETKKSRMLFLSVFSVLTALLFKETAVTFLLTLVVLIIIKAGKSVRRGALLSLGGVSLLYILLRSLYLFTGTKVSEAVTVQAGGNTFFVIFYNVVTLPFKIFSQILLPNESIVAWTNEVIAPFNLYKSIGRGPWVLESGLSYDILMIPAGIIIFLIIFASAKKSFFKFGFYTGLSVIFFSLMPFLIIQRYLVYFDSRYLYTATAGFGLIISFIFADLYKSGIKTEKKFRYVAIPVMLIIIISHFFTLKGTVSAHVDSGSIRKMIINKIHFENPKLPDKVIFFTESDISYYGLSDQDKILPFQSGFGQTLLVYYQRQERYTDKFFGDFFLWEIKEQGYREADGRGFGYFRDFDLLKKAVKQYNIPTASVIAYSWNGSVGTLINITEKTRVKLGVEEN